MKKICIMIQARSGSKRLPNKILYTINNKTILEYLISRLKQSFLGKNIIIATTTNKQDQKIVDICLKNEVKYFKGSENNVYKRFYDASIKYDFKHVCRICSDCPLINIELLDKMVTIYNENDLDSLCSIGGPFGIDKYISIFNINALNKYYRYFNSSHKEHVTKYIYDNPDNFKLKFVLDHKEYHEHELFKKYLFYNIKLSLDNYDDFIIIKNILNFFDNNVKLTKKDIMNYLNNNTDLLTINNGNDKKNDLEYALKYYNKLNKDMLIYL